MSMPTNGPSSITNCTQKTINPRGAREHTGLKDTRRPGGDAPSQRIYSQCKVQLSSCDSPFVKMQEVQQYLETSPSRLLRGSSLKGNPHGQRLRREGTQAMSRPKESTVGRARTPAGCAHWGARHASPTRHPPGDTPWPHVTDLPGAEESGRPPRSRSAGLTPVGIAAGAPPVPGAQPQRDIRQEAAIHPRPVAVGCPEG